MENSNVLVIDLFSGPGGLGEGISSCTDESGNSPFEIAIAVEKEPSAHKTLTTRSFFRKIANKPASRNDYYSYVRGIISREELFSKYPTEYKATLEETLGSPKALGEDNKLIHGRIQELVSSHIGPKLVIGGPPCQAYSLAGRSRNAGIEDYSAEKDHRNFLYLEYLKVLCIAQPDVFVMENVRGILSAKINGKIMFSQILKDLRKPGKVTKIKNVPGYRIYSVVEKAENPKNPQYKDSSDFLIRSELFGVPQARHRVILVGVREDIDSVPDTITRADETVSVKDVLGDLPKLRSGFSKQTDETHSWTKTVKENAAVLINIFKPNYENEALSNINLEPLADLPRKSHNKYQSVIEIPQPLKDWLLDDDLDHISNHETRGHTEADLLRYAFCSAFALLNNGVSPKSRDFPEALAPAHKNWLTGAHADRFRVQSANKYATTVTSHISKDGHYFIHYDPQQCRSLTVREAARLQTFPDNYLFEGNRTQQYVQVGNAVPPFLAKQIGNIVLKVLSKT